MRIYPLPFNNHLTNYTPNISQLRKEGERKIPATLSPKKLYNQLLCVYTSCLKHPTFSFGTFRVKGLIFKRYYKIGSYDKLTFYCND